MKPLSPVTKLQLMQNERLAKQKMAGPRGRSSTERNMSSSAMDPAMIGNGFVGENINGGSEKDAGANFEEASSSVQTKQSMASATFNLVKANLGTGVFALPAGIAAFGDVPSA